MVQRAHLFVFHIILLDFCTYDALDCGKKADLRVGWKQVLKKGGRVVDSDWPRVGQWQSILAAPAPLVLLVLLVVSSGRGGAARTALDQLHQQGAVGRQDSATDHLVSKELEIAAAKSA